MLDCFPSSSMDVGSPRSCLAGQNASRMATESGLCRRKGRDWRLFRRLSAGVRLDGEVLMRFRRRPGPGSRRRAAAEVRHAPEANACGDVRQLLTCGREESAEEMLPSQLLKPHLPRLGRAPEPLKHPRKLARNRRFAVAVDAARENPRTVVVMLDCFSSSSVGVSSDRSLPRRGKKRRKWRRRAALTGGRGEIRVFSTASARGFAAHPI